MSFNIHTINKLLLIAIKQAPPAEGDPGAGVDNLLLESGDHLLLENVGTDVLLLE